MPYPGVGLRAVCRRSGTCDGVMRTIYTTLQVGLRTEWP